MLFNKKRNFCDINPFFYLISYEKEILKRRLKNLFGRDRFTKTVSEDKLGVTVFRHHSSMIKHGSGIDPVLQENKVNNIKIACGKISGTVVHPGETFSFWKTVGNTTARKGYKAGRIIAKGKLQPGTGGGLCNLANTLNLLILHSPLRITEFHKHSDALAPEDGPRVPLSSGTSVSYNYVDYRFRNDTDQDVQILLWSEGDELYGELRSETGFDLEYRIVEEGHRFVKEGEKFYRVSKIYKVALDPGSGETVEKELIWDNHSEVMYDYGLIPGELCET